MNKEQIQPHLGLQFSLGVQSTMMTSSAQLREEDKRVHLENTTKIEFRNFPNSNAAVNKLETSQGSTSVIMFDALSKTATNPTKLSVGALKLCNSESNKKSDAVGRMSLKNTGFIKKFEDQK